MLSSTRKPNLSSAEWVGWGEGNTFLRPVTGLALSQVCLLISQDMTFLSNESLSDFTFIFHFHALEKEMATHSSVLAWRIPGMGEPGGLPSMGSHKVDTTEAT